MKRIEFDAPFGVVMKKVKLLSNEYGSGGYQVYIDNGYHGDIFFKDGVWQGHLNSKSFLTGDDITILGEMIDKENKNPNA